VIIEVTAEDIKNGKPRAGAECAIALAMKRAGFPNVRVGGYSIWKNIEDSNLDDSNYCATPSAVTHWIDQFDKGQPVEPFAFEIPWTTATATPTEQPKAKKKAAKKKAKRGKRK
jgi:hypothetical protein